VLRCPVPNCVFQERLSVPCGCGGGPKTVLYIQGCATACADGCMTRTSTVSASACPTSYGAGDGGDDDDQDWD